MVGAILGDIIGSPFEFDRGEKTKDFCLFTNGVSTFTDDTVMTIAVAEALMEAGPDADIETIKKCCIKSMKKWGQKYPNSGFGGRFISWVLTDDPQPYGSYGNGSAMRVSPAGWLYDSLEKTREVAKATAEVTHNHPEGIKGAEATASVIYLARIGKSKDEIKQYVIDEFGYDLSRTLDEIRPGYYHVEDCMRSVPEAITAFLEGENFEDVVRNVVSLGGDTDTLGAIAGAMAEAFYGVPMHLFIESRRRVPEIMWDVMKRFDLTRRDNTFLELSIDHALENWDENNVLRVLELLRDSVLWVPCTAIMSDVDEARILERLEKAEENLDSLVGMEWQSEDSIRLVPDVLMNEDGYFFPAFTSAEAAGEYGQRFSMIPGDMLGIINMARNNEKEIKGIVINAFSKSFMMPMEICGIVEKLESRIGR